MPTQPRDLLDEIEAILPLMGVTASTFGMIVVNDGKLVQRLRRGGSVLVRTDALIRRFIAEERDRIAAGLPRPTTMERRMKRFETWARSSISSPPRP